MRLFPLLFALLLCLLAAGCYEDRIACLDLGASNYDILADEPCPDCCEFPALRLDLERAFGPADLALTDTFVDAAGNRVRLIDLRAYASDLSLLTADGSAFPATVEPVETFVVTGSDTALTDFAETVVLLSTTGAATLTVGRVRTGEAFLTGLGLQLGFREDYPLLVPAAGPAGSPLRTQPRLLNRNDGTGYQTLSLEYELTDRAETRRVDVYADRLIELSFPFLLEPLPGADLTLELRLDYATVLGGLDLSESSAALAAPLLANYAAALTVTGAR